MILGGGINGAALARELVLNRTPVCLVDISDLASGATAFSSRLIHGGLRYLEHGEFDLVRESLAERKRLLRLAPQFVRPLRLFIPVERRWGGLLASALKFLGYAGGKSSSARARGLWLIRWGLWLYDRYAKDADLPRRAIHRVGSEACPAVDPHTFRWLCSYYDAQIAYPERFVLTLLADARRLAAEHQIAFDVYTYHQAKLHDGRVSLFPSLDTGATSDRPTAVFEPAAIVNATGAWVDRTLARLEVPSRRLIGGTKGSHFVTSHATLRRALGPGGLYAEAADGRPFFILPLGNATLVGTTDLPFDQSPERAVASEEELSYLLAGVNRILPQVGLRREDIDFHYSGLRPLPYVGQATPGSITRRHWLEEHADCEAPLYSVIGGKLTTCRSLAEEAAAKILARLGRRPQTNSRDRPLPGAESYPSDEKLLGKEQERLAIASGCTLTQVQAVWQLCGTRAAELLGDLGPSLSHEDRQSVEGCEYPRGFVRHVIREEWALRLSDLVERRLMLLYHRHLGECTLRELASLLVAEGRLRDEQVEPEVQACIARLANQFGKQVT